MIGTPGLSSHRFCGSVESKYSGSIRAASIALIAASRNSLISLMRQLMKILFLIMMYLFVIPEE
jgi:hypothetical protein